MKKNSTEVKMEEIEKQLVPSTSSGRIPSAKIVPTTPGNQSDDDDVQLKYHETLMYGYYTKEMGEKVRYEARRLKEAAEEQDDEDDEEPLHPKPTYFNSCLYYFFHLPWVQSGEHWILLAILGIIMAMLSFAMDFGIHASLIARNYFFHMSDQVPTQFIIWTIYSLVVMFFAIEFVHIVAPQSVGSGIPELKTIMKGVKLKQYLTFKTLLAKVVGLTATLGAGMPLGKEAPYVHIAAIVAQLLSNLSASVQTIYDETKNKDLLIAACAVGISACFMSPIGSLLYSIEATATYFAIRNYWRGFYASVISSLVLPLLIVWVHDDTTIKPMFATSFDMEKSYAEFEMLTFAVLGAICGFGGAFYVWFHRKYIMGMRSWKTLSDFLQERRLLYPMVVTFVTATLTFPHGWGKYHAGELSTPEHLQDLFTNFSWTSPNISNHEAKIVARWTTENSSIFFNLGVYSVYTFFISIITSTMAIPCGLFIPTFKLGAGIGRLVGEAFNLWFPVIPGTYAVAGAAAFTGAVTHTISVAIICFEITGQLSHLLPVMICILVANAVAGSLELSIYDSIIVIKKLPYLPSLLTTNARVYNIYVEDFMLRDVRFIWNGMTYKKLSAILRKNKDIRSFPLVDSRENMVLLGSVHRQDLIAMVQYHVGRERRQHEAVQWIAQRRPSRFEITMIPDLPAIVPRKKSPLNFRRSLLAKTNSVSLFDSILRRATSEDTEYGVLGGRRRVRMPVKRVSDMSPEDKKAWREEQLAMEINFNEEPIVIDPAPFQLVEQTSLLKAHGLFIMVGVKLAYVTSIGRLVGVVGLKELRNAITSTSSKKRASEADPAATEPFLPKSHPDYYSTTTSEKSLMEFSESISSVASENPPGPPPSLAEEVNEKKK